MGIPTVRDRVVQAAVLLIVEPIFEADFEDCSYGFRPGRSAHDALRQIRQHLKGGLTAVYDADLAGYFDSIPHDKLLACLRMRVVDGSVLGLIRQWLNAPVVEPPKDGDPPTVKRNERGTPQGGVLSLANVYLHWFDHVFHRTDGPGQWAKAKLIRYADDFVVLARYQSVRLRAWWASRSTGTKPACSICGSAARAWTSWATPSGWTATSMATGSATGTFVPSRKALARERHTLRGLINPHQSHTPLPELIGRVNRHLRGWANYFGLGYPRQTFRHLNHFVRDRLGKHLRRRSQRGWRPRQGRSLYAHLNHLGLVSL